VGHQPVAEIHQPVEVVAAGQQEEDADGDCSRNERLPDEENGGSGQATCHISRERVEP